MSEIFDYGSSEKLLKDIKERSDDIDSVSIMVSNEILLVSPDGSQQVIPDCASTIDMCDGKPRIIHWKDLELLLNDGILNRLKIPIRLVQREER